MHRTPIVALAALLLVALGVGIGWVLFGAVVRPAPVETARHSMPGAEAEPAAPSLRGPVPERGGTSVDASPAPEAEAATEPARPGRAGGRIEVRLDVPEGWPPMRGEVYALPAGSGGAREKGSVPTATLWKGEVGPLHVPFAGRWDVFYAAGWSSGEVLDVEVPEEGVVEVRLAPHPSGRIAFRLDDDLPDAWTTKVLVGVQLRSTGYRNASPVPGRGQGARITATAWFDDEGVAQTHPLPEGRTYDAAPLFLKREEANQPGRRPSLRHPSGSHRLVLERTEVEAGDAVAVHVLARARLRITARIDHAPPPSWEGWTSHAALTLAVAGGHGDHASIGVKPGYDPTTSLACVLWGDPGVGRLTWGGAQGIEPGALDGVRLVAGETTTAEIVLHVDTSFSPYEAYRAKPEDQIHLRVDGWPESGHEDAELVLFGRIPDGENAGRLENLLLDWPRQTSFHRESFAPRTVVAVVTPGLASRPATVGPDGELHLELEEAGYLLVAPGRVLASGSGAIVLERADGYPFPAGFAEADGPPGVSTIDVRVTVGPGWLVGPLLPGEHRFHAWLGGVRLPDAVGRVRAGRIDVLRVGMP